MRDEEEHRSVAKQSLDALLVLDPLGQENFVQQLTDAIHASEEAGLPAEDLCEAKGKRIEALEVKQLKDLTAALKAKEHQESRLLKALEQASLIPENCPIKQEAKDLLERVHWIR